MPENRVSEFEVDQMLRVISNHNAKVEYRANAVRFFRKLLSQTAESPFVQPLLEGNILVPALVDCLLDFRHTWLQTDSAWALTNIACGVEWETHTMVNAGAIPKLITLGWQHENLELRDQAIWALSNIAGDCKNCRIRLLANGFLPLLFYTLQSELEKSCNPPLQLSSTGTGMSSVPGISSLRTVVWALSNMFRARPAIPFEDVKPILPTLNQLLQNPLCPNDMEITTDVCWSLAYLADGTGEQIEEVVQSGVCPVVVSFLSHSDIRLVNAALRTIGNIVTGNDAETEVVINCGAVGMLYNLLLNDQKQSLHREVVWTLSNITAGTTQQIQSILEHRGLIYRLIQLLAEAHDEGVWSCNWVYNEEADWNWIATGSLDNSVKIWSWTEEDSLKLLHTLDAHQLGVISTDISRDCSTVASSGIECALKAWELDTGNLLCNIDAGPLDSWTVRFFPDGKRIASGSQGGRVNIFNVESGLKEGALESGGKMILSLCFSPDGKQLAAASQEGIVFIFDVETSQLLHTLEARKSARYNIPTGHAMPVRGLSYTPDSQILVTGSDDKYVKMHDIGSTTAPICTLPGHVSWVLSIDCSPDGRQFASGSADRSVRIWDVGERKQLHKFSEHNDQVWGVSYNHRGSRLMSVSDDKKIIVYNIPL